MVVFAGYCPICGEYFAWDDLTQKLSCLEAKNNGTFSDCKNGVHIDEHEFDQECDVCAEENAADDGIDLDMEAEVQPRRDEDTPRKGKGRAAEQRQDEDRKRKRQRVS